MAGREEERSACPSPPELRDVLGGVEYPASRDELIARVEETGAPADVRQVLEALEPQLFDSPASVERAVQALSS